MGSEKVNGIPFEGTIDCVEHGNHLVQVGPWTGVASEWLDKDGLTQGTVVYLPSVKVEEIASAKPIVFN